MILKIKMNEEYDRAWQCTECGTEKCVLCVPGTKEKPEYCPLNRDSPEWEPYTEEE